MLRSLIKTHITYQVMNVTQHNLRFISRWKVPFIFVSSLQIVFQRYYKVAPPTQVCKPKSNQNTENIIYKNNRWDAEATGVSIPNSSLIDTSDEIIKCALSPNNESKIFPGCIFSMLKLEAKGVEFLKLVIHQVNRCTNSRKFFLN